MDKTVPYDEPLDPYWETLNGLAGTVEEIAGDKSDPNYYPYLNQAKDNVVPFLTRMARAREMAANIDRAIEDGHLQKFPDLDGVAITFRTFADKAETLGYERDESEPKEGLPKFRDEWLEIYSLAWATLRRLEGNGFPLMDYVTCRALGSREL